MNKSKPRITIVGMGLIGSSIGLAIKEADVASAIVGHDKDSNSTKQAKKLGAVDRNEWNLITACEDSDIVVLAIPIGGIEETLKAIAPYLKEGCVILDTTSLKVPVLAWADEILPDHAHFVGINPIIAYTSGIEGGAAAARPDLFIDRLFCVVPSVKASPEVVKLATDMVAILGAKPLFMDAAEHDGLMGAVDHLPPLTALALMDMTVNQPAWRELRKVAGAAFEASTHLGSNDPETYSELFVANRENLVRWVDALTASLASIRQALEEQDTEQLANQFEGLMKERNRWLLNRQEGNWEPGSRPEMPPKPNLLDTFLGGFWRKRPPKDQQKD